jgi:glycine/D-amino acid oxidase-like deaminating enzyme
MGTDVTVFGAGVFGLAIAYACAVRGAAVTVIDPRGAGGGSSGGIVGALAPHVPENWNEKKAFQLDSLLMSADFWAGVAARSGLSTGYARTGRLQPLEDSAACALARTRGQGAATLWQGRAVWEVVEAEGTGDFAPQSASGWLIRDTLSAHVHPSRACLALAGAVQALGGRLLRTPPDALPAGPVVWATGHEGLQALRNAAGRPAGTGIKGQAVLLRHPTRPGTPQVFAGGLHLIPHDDGTVAVGSTTERDYDDPTSTDASADALADRARQVCPALAHAPILSRWAGIRPRARTRAPLLGRHPSDPLTYLANGGFKIGFGIAPKVAQVMADLILDGRDTIPDGFRPEASL